MWWNFKWSKTACVIIRGNNVLLLAGSTFKIITWSVSLMTWWKRYFDRITFLLLFRKSSNELTVIILVYCLKMNSCSKSKKKWNAKPLTEFNLLVQAYAVWQWRVYLPGVGPQQVECGTDCSYSVCPHPALEVESEVWLWVQARLLPYLTNSAHCLGSSPASCCVECLLLIRDPSHQVL